MPILGLKLDINRCPHCNVAKPNIQKVHSFTSNNYAETNGRVWCAYVCSTCGGALLASGGSSNSPVYEIYPGETIIESAIPNPARNYLQQAIESIHAPAGAVMLAASAVDAMLKSKDYTEGSLYSRIDKAAREYLITEDMAKWAHQVRLDANEQRHADVDAQLPDEKDAKRCIDFTLALGQFLFVLPALVKNGLENTL